MIRWAALLWLGLAAGVAFGLFQLKYEVHRLEGRLTAVREDIRREREAVHVLEAEWSYLNRPERIAALARRHLRLGPLEPAQVRSLEALPPRRAAVEAVARAPQGSVRGEQVGDAASAKEKVAGGLVPQAAAPPPAVKPALPMRLPAAVRRTLASLRSTQ